jgi:methylenetetrahydrofolate reductase (NADPH)
MGRIMRNKTQVTDTTVRLLENARYEVLPTATIEDKVLEHVPVDLTVTVTASPNKGLEPTLDLTERLIGHGYVAVPHLAARMVRDKAELAEI